MKIPKLSLPQRTRTRVGALVALVAVVAVGAGAGYRMFTGLPDDAVLEYDGQVITQHDLDERVDALGALYGIQKPAAADDQDTFQRDAAKAVAVSLILDDAAEEHDIVISDKSARDTLAAMLEEQLADPRKDFNQLLAKFGISEDDVLEEIKRQQAIALLFREITQDAVDGVGADDVRSYFDDDPSRFALPEQRRLSNIVVSNRKDARTVVAAVRGGTDFATVARKVSLDDATRDKGGDLGTVTAAELDEAFAEPAFAAGKGRVFGPVKTPYGWNVGRVVAVTPGRAMPFARVKDQVADAARSEAALKAWRQWLKDEIKDADVEYADDYRPKNADEPPADAGVNPGTLEDR
ncbi:peptidyl-prolyl cis-trans isomerase [Nocardioides sp. Root151]|uniref:peptidylprolyl isomerase n=1 Tax=Nocardioides sp. Root151 TaxID=1736475 RepID=UPI000703A7DF|nr:peptidyl-prolyl cis-trans isomerase [Nocardioides sp. Root151]KQZ68738.1 peptidylprolyl isomerase [Nocardioides sp. Root151]